MPKNSLKKWMYHPPPRICLLRPRLLFAQDGIVRIDGDKSKIDTRSDPHRNFFYDPHRVARTFYSWIVYRGGVCCWRYSPHSATLFTPFLNPPWGTRPVPKEFRKFSLHVIESLDEVLVCGVIRISTILELETRNGKFTKKSKIETQRIRRYYLRRNRSVSKQHPNILFDGTNYRSIYSDKEIEEELGLWFQEYRHRLGAKRLHAL